MLKINYTLYGISIYSKCLPQHGRLKHYMKVQQNSTATPTARVAKLYHSCKRECKSLAEPKKKLHSHFPYLNIDQIMTLSEIEI